MNHGKIDYLGLSAGTYDSLYAGVPDMRFPLGAFEYMAAGTRQAVEERIPVIGGGRTS